MAVARTPGEVEETSALAKGRGGYCLATRADVTDESDVEAMIERTRADLGPIDLLVNNAGGCRAVGELWTHPAQEWWGDLELNLKSAMLCSHAVLPAMLARGRGRIVNVGSLQSSKPTPLNSAYSCAKAALVLFSESLACAVAGRGITVFTVSPGLVHTGAVDQMLATEDGRRCFPELIGMPEERFVPPERAAEMITTIATGVADALTGRFLHVSDDLFSLLSRAAEIRDGDQLTMRLRR